MYLLVAVFGAVRPDDTLPVSVFIFRAYRRCDSSGLEGCHQVRQLGGPPTGVRPTSTLVLCGNNPLVEQTPLGVGRYTEVLAQEERTYCGVNVGAAGSAERSIEALGLALTVFYGVRACAMRVRAQGLLPLYCILFFVEGRLRKPPTPIIWSTTGRRLFWFIDYSIVTLCYLLIVRKTYIVHALYFFYTPHLPRSLREPRKHSLRYS